MVGVPQGLVLGFTYSSSLQASSWWNANDTQLYLIRIFFCFSNSSLWLHVPRLSSNKTRCFKAKPILCKMFLGLIQMQCCPSENWIYLTCQIFKFPEHLWAAGCFSPSSSMVAVDNMSPLLREQKKKSWLDPESQNGSGLIPLLSSPDSSGDDRTSR